MIRRRRRRRRESGFAGTSACVRERTVAALRLTRRRRPQHRGFAPRISFAVARHSCVSRVGSLCVYLRVPPPTPSPESPLRGTVNPFARADPLVPLDPYGPTRTRDRLTVNVVRPESSGPLDRLACPDKPLGYYRFFFFSISPSCRKYFHAVRENNTRIKNIIIFFFL